MANRFITRCDACNAPTWYETEQPCKMSYPKRKDCPTCAHIELDHDKMIPCPGTLRLIDWSGLAPAFTPYLHDFTRRLEVTSGGYTRRGYVGITTGRKPSYLLLPRRDSRWSSDLLDQEVRIVKVINK